MWLSPQAIQAWYYQGPTRRGSAYTYSAVADHTTLLRRHAGLKVALPVQLRRCTSWWMRLA